MPTKRQYLGTQSETINYIIVKNTVELFYQMKLFTVAQETKHYFNHKIYMGKKLA